MEFIEKYINNIMFGGNNFNCGCLSSNIFRLENKRIKQKELYWLLENKQMLPRTVELVMIQKYM